MKHNCIHISLSSAIFLCFLCASWIVYLEYLGLLMRHRNGWCTVTCCVADHLLRSLKEVALSIQRTLQEFKIKCDRKVQELSFLKFSLYKTRDFVFYIIHAFLNRLLHALRGFFEVFLFLLGSFLYLFVHGFLLVFVLYPSMVVRLYPSIRLFSFEVLLR